MYDDQQSGGSFGGGFQRRKPEEAKPSPKVFVGGLKTPVTKEQLQEAFSKCVTVIDAFPMPERDGMRREFGFVTFSNVEEATKAVNELNGTELAGNQISVSFAREKKEGDRGGFGGNRGGGYDRNSGGGDDSYGDSGWGQAA